MSTPSENPSFKSELASQLGVMESLLPKNIDSKLNLQDVKAKAYIDELKAKLATIKTDRERSAFFEQKLQNVSFSEATDKLQTGVEDVQKSLNAMAPEALNKALETTQGQLTTEMKKSGMDAARAVNDLANSKNSGEVTTSIGKIADIAKSVEGAFDTAMGTIGNLLKKLLEMTGFGKFLSYFGFSLDDEKKDTGGDGEKTPGESAKDTVGNAAQAAEKKARETTGTPENIAEKMKIAKEKYWGMLEKNGWIREPAKQKQAFEKLWGEKSGEIQKHLEKVSTATMNNKEWNLMTDIFEPGVFGPVRFLLQLVIRGVIPKEAIFSTVLDLSKGTIKLGFQTAESLIHGTPEKTAKLIGEFASTDLTKLSPEEKSLILASVHHNMALTLAIAGKMAQATGALALMPLYWEQGSGVYKLKAFGNGITGDFVAAGKNMDSMLAMLGDVDPNSPARKYYNEMFAVVREVQLKSELTAKYMEMQKAGKSYTQISDELRLLVSGSETKGHRFFGIGDTTKEAYLKMLSELPKNHGETSLLQFLENKNHVSTQNIVSKVGQLMGSSVGSNPAEIRITQTIEQSSNVGKGLSEVVKNKESLWKIYSKMHLGMKFEEFIAAIDRGVLPIVAQDTNKAKEIMQRFMRAIPPGFDHFFSSLAVVLTIAHVSSSDDKLKTLGQDIAMMNPFWGGYILIQEGLQVQGTKMEKTGYLVVGGAVMSIGMLQLAKIASTSGSARIAAISELALGPIHTFGRGIGALARGVSYTSLFARNVEKPGAIRPFIQPKALGSYAMIAALVMYFGYSQYSEEKKMEFLTKEKLLRPDGSYDMAMLRSKFGSLPEVTRSDLLEKILNQELASQGVSATVSQGGKQTVVNGVSQASDRPPISIDTFSQISDMMKEVGNGTSSIYLSQSATEATKKYIAAAPVSDLKKKEFMAQFGIPA